jgi:pimeloyl-ACP methyl ester carboxylesterase
MPGTPPEDTSPAEPPPEDASPGETSPGESSPGAVSPGHLTWRTIEVQGRVAQYGEAGEGTPFIFLHGWGLRDQTYKRALGRLAGLGLRVLAPSLPGFGGTARLPAGSFSIEGYAEWVADFAAATGVDGPFLLGGHSFGGGVAISTAHAHGSQCTLLVLVNSIGGAVWRTGDHPDVPGAWLADRPMWDWGIRFPSDLPPFRVMSRVLPVVLQDAARNVLRDPFGFWRVGVLARQANLLGELEALKRRGLPVVVMWGNEDRILPSASFEAIVHAAGADPVVVEGSHSWMLVDPDRFGELMTNVVSVAAAAEEAARTGSPEITPPAARPTRPAGTSTAGTSTAGTPTAGTPTAGPPETSSTTPPAAPEVAGEDRLDTGGGQCSSPAAS